MTEAGVPLTKRGIMAAMAQATSTRPKATPETTGPGAVLTDGKRLYEVTDCMVRKVKVGKRTLSVPHRRIADAEADVDALGGWVPMAEVMALDVVRAVDYEDPEPKAAAS